MYAKLIFSWSKLYFKPEILIMNLGLDLKLIGILEKIVIFKLFFKITQNCDLNSNKLGFYVYGDFIANYAMHEKSFTEFYSVEDFNKLCCFVIGGR